MSKVVPSPRPAPAGAAVGISPKEEEEKVVAADSPRGSEQSSAGNAALAATSDGRAAGAASGTPDKGTQKMFEMLAERSARANKFRAMTETANTRDALTSYDIQRIINGIPAELRLEIAKVFAIIDDDSSGAISMDELASMFRDLGKPQSTRGMKAMFRVIDADRNGEIDFFEFQLLFWKLHQKVAFEADTLHGSHEEIAAAQAEAASLRRRSAESIGNVDADGEEDTDSLRPTCRETLWAIMEHPSSSRVALFVSIIIMGLILLSTVMFLLESYSPPKNYQVDPLDAPYYIELVCVIAFTVEFVLRLASTPNLCQFFLGFMNIIDLVAILPFYLEKLLAAADSEGGATELTIIRVVRLFRIFRLFKFSRYLTWIRLLAHALRDSVLPLAMVFVLLLIMVVIYASLMYTLERGSWNEAHRMYISAETGEPSMFQSIVHGIYFGIVTSTTVGYGDQFPVTVMGKFVGGIGCVCGILIMVIPISIFSNNFELIFAAHQQRLLQKKEHIATEDLRELLTGDVPLYKQIIEARRKRGEEIPAEVLNIINATANDESSRTAIRAGRGGITVAGADSGGGTSAGAPELGIGSRVQRWKTELRETRLEPYHSFLDRLINTCHQKIDSERESLRKHIAKIHRAHRKHLLMNVEDLWANWFAVPVGELVDDPN